MEWNTRENMLATLPMSARVLVTLFVTLVGFGYLAALGNLYHQHQMADGREGLTLDDLRATFHGIPVADDQGQGTTTAASNSRMLEMVGVGGEMRKHVAKGGPASIRALEGWLTRGAKEAEFSVDNLGDEGDPSAQDVIERYCLRCHNADSGEKSDAPYGPDMFSSSYEMVRVYAAPGTAQQTQQPDSKQASTPRMRGPSSVGHLFLITHIHMLSIPVFTLIVSGFFLVSGLKPGLKEVIGPIPMLILVTDFSSWWLARAVEGFLYLIAASGAIFGLVFGFQILTVLVSLWWPRRPIREKLDK